MIAFKLKTDTKLALDVWGPPENLAAVTLEGKPIMHGKALYGASEQSHWLFDVDKARTKLHRAYDKLTGQN